MIKYINGVLRLNENNRWCVIDPDTREGLIEITSGNVVEIFENNEWISTRIEFDGSENKYYSVAGLKLDKDMSARMKT